MLVKSTGYLAPVSLDVLKQIRACKDAIINSWKNSSEKNHNLNHVLSMVGGTKDDIREVEKSKTLEQNINEIVREKFAELRKYICEGVPEKNISTFLIGLSINATEYELNASIESLFGGDTAKTQRKEQ